MTSMHMTPWRMYIKRCNSGIYTTGRKTGLLFLVFYVSKPEFVLYVVYNIAGLV